MFRIVTRHNINLDLKEILAIFSHLPESRAVSGDAIRRFEDAFAAYHKRRFSVALYSGRAALFCILKALPIEPGAEVVVPAYSFFTIPDVVRAAGFEPVFAPVDPETYALDPERMEPVISKKCKAVIVEHPFGQPAPMKEIVSISDRYGLAVVEDPSQSIGAGLYGTKAGGFGLAAAFSLVHGKNLMTFGGGMVLTDDEELYRSILGTAIACPEPEPEKVRRTALQGLANWFLTTKPGFAAGPFLPFYALNLLDRSRLDSLFKEEVIPFDPSRLEQFSNLQAALGLRQLARLDERNARRRTNAQTLMDGIAGLPGLGLPKVVPGGVGTWNALPLRVPRASEIQRKLLLYGVDSRADYMSLFAFEEEWRKSGEVFYIPNHPGMSESDIRHVIRTLRRVLRS